MTPPLTPALRERVEHTIRFLAADAVQRANSGHPGAPMGLARAGVPALGLAPALRSRRSRAGRCATASCSRMATPRCCSTRCSISTSTRSRSTTSRASASSTRRRRAIPSTATRPASRSRQDRSGRASPTASAWRSPRARRARASPGEGGPGNHFVYGVVSDGDLMEGISAEAGSLAGHWRLGNLIYLYDDNRITIDGPTSLCFSEDVRERFEAQHWHVQEIDGEDVAALEAALAAARAETDRPSLVITRTVIGRGSAVAGQSKAHGSPLGADNAREAKHAVGWPTERELIVPDDVRAYFARARRSQARRAPRARCAARERGAASSPRPRRPGTPRASAASPTTSRRASPRAATASPTPRATTAR